MTNCKYCKADCIFRGEQQTKECKGYIPMTNADRIRAMSDEELAEFLILSPEMEFDVCLLCQFGNKTPMDDRGQCLSGYGACDAESRAEAFKKWLKQPAE